MPESSGDEENSQEISGQSMLIDRPVLTQQMLNQWIGHTGIVETPTFLDQVRKASIKTVRFLAPSCLNPRQGEKQLSRLTNAPLDDKPVELQEKFQTRVFLTWIASFLPFISILHKYDMKNWFVNDLIAGITVGIMHVPQGMAYAMLATLPPVYGLYTSFFPPLVYFFFGTSRHISIGTIAVVSLLTGEFLDKVVEENLHQTGFAIDPSINNSVLARINHGNDSSDPTSIRIRYAPALALTVGLSQVVMGLFRMGGVIRYLSGPMTSGFTVGVAVHVFTSQVTTLLGVKIVKPVGLFNVPRTYYAVFRAITTVNAVTISLSATCIVIIFVVKTWISPPVAKRIRVPVPIDLFVVILATITSYFLKLDIEYNVKVVGHVSKGILTPTLPRLSQMHSAIEDIIVLAVVSFSVNVSLSRIFAKTFNYKVDCNQELYAYGLSNIVSSFFHTFPSAASLSRSAVQVSAGGKTQVATIFSSILLILVLFFIGPLFYTVPNCCLSAIIVVALKGMFKHTSELKHLWNYSIWDFIIWLSTCICTMMIDVKFGLLSGIAISFLTIILRTQSPKTSVLSHVAGTELYRDLSNVDVQCTQPDIIKVVRYEGNIYYACADQFRHTVHTRVGLDPSYIFHRLRKLQYRLQRLNKTLGLDRIVLPVDLTTTEGNEKRNSTIVTTTDDQSIVNSDSFHATSVSVPDPMFSFKLKSKREMLISQIRQLEEKCNIQFLILDCSCWTFLDFAGAEELNQLIDEYRRIHIVVLLAELNNQLAQTLHKNGKLPKETELFPSVHDAVLWALSHGQSGESHLQHVRKMINTNLLATDQSMNPDNSGEINETDEQSDQKLDPNEAPVTVVENL